MEEKDQPVDMAVAMDAAHEFLTLEMLAKLGEIFDASLPEAQQEQRIYALLEEFNCGLNELYRSKLKEKMGDDDG